MAGQQHCHCHKCPNRKSSRRFRSIDDDHDHSFHTSSDTVFLSVGRSGTLWVDLISLVDSGILSEFCWEFISTKKSRVGTINQGREIEKSGSHSISESEAWLWRCPPEWKYKVFHASPWFFFLVGSSCVVFDLNKLIMLWVFGDDGVFFYWRLKGWRKKWEKY